MNDLAATVRTAFVIGCLLGSTGWVNGEEMIMQLIALKEKRDAAVQKVVTEINVTYGRELEKLLAIAVSNGDRKNSERIRAEIQLIGKSDVQEDEGGSVSMTKLERLLLKGAWDWFTGSPDSKLVNSGRITFLKGGEVERSGSLHFIKSWKIVDANRFEVIQNSGNRWLFEYDSEDEIARSIKGAGYIGDHKTLAPSR